jgi:hypothetical protein
VSTASPSTKVRTALVVAAHPDDVDFGRAERRAAADLLGTLPSQEGENPNPKGQTRPIFAAVASKYGLPDGHLAEEFQVVDTS